MCVYDSLFFEACVCLVGWLAFSGGVAEVLWSLGSVVSALLTGLSMGLCAEKSWPACPDMPLLPVHWRDVISCGCVLYKAAVGKSSRWGLLMCWCTDRSCSRGTSCSSVSLKLS